MLGGAVVRPNLILNDEPCEDLTLGGDAHIFHIILFMSTRGKLCLVCRDRRVVTRSGQFPNNGVRAIFSKFNLVCVWLRGKEFLDVLHGKAHGGVDLLCPSVVTNSHLDTSFLLIAERKNCGRDASQPTTIGPRRVPKVSSPTIISVDFSEGVEKIHVLVVSWVRYRLHPNSSRVWSVEEQSS